MSKQTVLFNALLTVTSAGVGRYSFELLRAMLASNPDFGFHVICDKETEQRIQPYLRQDWDKAVVVKRPASGKQRIIAEQFKILGEFPKADLVHYPDYSVPIFCARPTVITMHDMAKVRFPNTYNLGQRIWNSTMLRISVKKASKIICVSNFTKRELIDIFKVSAEKTDVVYNGLNPLNNAVATDDAVFREFGIGESYILSVNTIEPRKNIVSLIRSFDKLRRHGAVNQLVLVGATGWLSKPIFQEVRALGLEGNVVFTGFVSDNKLLALYRNAKAFVYVSLYEGFGFPPLESMACGVPAVVSNVASLPEVMGDAAAYVEPLNIDSICETVQEVLTNDTLRKRLIERGVERCALFEWRRAAKETIQVYQSLLSSSKISRRF